MAITPSKVCPSPTSHPWAEAAVSKPRQDPLLPWGKGWGLLLAQWHCRFYFLAVREAGVVLPVGEWPRKSQGLRYSQTSHQVSDPCSQPPTYTSRFLVCLTHQTSHEINSPFPALIFISQRTSPSVLNDGLEWKLHISVWPLVSACVSYQPPNLLQQSKYCAFGLQLLMRILRKKISTVACSGKTERRKGKW